MTERTTGRSQSPPDSEWINHRGVEIEGAEQLANTIIALAAKPGQALEAFENIVHLVRGMRETDGLLVLSVVAQLVANPMDAAYHKASKDGCPDLDGEALAKVMIRSRRALDEMGLPACPVARLRLSTVAFTAAAASLAAIAHGVAPENMPGRDVTLPKEQSESAEGEPNG